MLGEIGLMSSFTRRGLVDPAARVCDRRVHLNVAISTCHSCCSGLSLSLRAAKNEIERKSLENARERNENRRKAVVLAVSAEK